MEARVVQFHFDYISPYSYLAWCQMGEFARRNVLRVEPRPIVFAALLNHLGHKGPGEILPKRIYMFKDCIRAAAELGVPFVPVHTHPFNPLPSLRASLLEMDDQVRIRLVTRLFDATWAESRDTGSVEVVAELCAEVGVPDVASRIAEPAVKQALRDATEQAIARGMFGVPTLMVDGELFWGTDSLRHLERYLEGADPVRPEDVQAWLAVPASAQR